MTPAEAQMLLGIAASFDNRKPSEEAATAWSVALDGIRFADARDAVIAHFRASSEWLMPAMVIREVKRIRRERVLAHGPIEPPIDMDPDDHESYSRWLSAAHLAVANGDRVPTFAAVQSGVPMPKEIEAQMAEFGRLPADVEKAGELA